MEEDERRRMLVSRLEMRQLTESLQLLQKSISAQEIQMQKQLDRIQLEFNEKVEELRPKPKVRPPKPIRTELKSMQLPPTIRQDQTGTPSNASISDVTL